MKKQLLVLVMILMGYSSYAADPVMPVLPNISLCGISPAFDLNVQTPIILSAQILPASNYAVMYYTTLTDALSGTNPIFNNYVPITSPQTVFAKISDIVTGEFAIGQFQLISFFPAIPTFTQIPPLCLNSTPMPLPNASLNGFVGTWTPAVIDTSVPGTNVYTFTADPGLCAMAVSMNVTVSPFTGTVPVFDAVPTLCAGATIAPLPTTSNNGITGVWSPALSNEVTQMYTFSPDNTTTCSAQTTMIITVNNCDGIKLHPFLDYNGNGVLDSGETTFHYAQFQYEMNNNGVLNYGSNPNGIFYIIESNPTNSYDVTMLIDPAYASLYTASTTSYSNLQIVAGAGLTTYYFPVTFTNLYNDLAVDIVPMGFPRPGFNYSNRVSYTNHSNHTMNGTVTFNHSPIVSITAVSPGTTPITNGFTYSFNNLYPFETRSIDVAMLVPTIPTVALGQLLTNTASIAPVVSDVTPLDNTTSEAQIIIGAYDPNDKTESHGPQIVYATYNSNDYFNYTVRFENTGTANALNVRIDDVLHNKLDESTIRTLSASHPYVFRRIGSNVTWQFDNIQLPPSVANSMIGHGYVTFQVKLKPGYAVGDVIPNTASIYFDFNPAIVTNTYQSTFVPQLAQEQFTENGISVYPNPTSESVYFDNAIAKYEQVAIYNNLGQEVDQHTLGFSNHETIEMGDLASGIYLLRLVKGGQSTTMKIVKR